MWLRDRFFTFPARVDRWLRRRDLALHRTAGSAVHRAGFVAGYSPLALLLPIPVLLVLAYGMPRWRGVGLALASGAALLLHLIIARTARGRWLPRLQWLLLAVFTSAVFLIAEPTAVEFDRAPYRHLFAVVGVLALTLGMPAARWLADLLIGRNRDRYRAAFRPHLPATQYLVTKKEVPHNWARVARAYALVPLVSPMMLLWLPAVAVLVAPSSIVAPAFWGVLAFTWAMLAASLYNRRLQAFQVLVRQLFLVGAPAAVSLLVIAIAVARLGGLDYVTTILDQASLRNVLGLVTLLYLTFWLYDYWLQRALAETLLGLLSDDRCHPDEVRYEGERMGCARLRIHGAGRVIAIRDDDARAAVAGEPMAQEAPNYESYRPIELFQRLHDQLEGRTRATAADAPPEAAAATWAEYDAVTDALESLEDQTRLYYALPAVVLTLALGLLGWRLAAVDQQPGLTVTDNASASLFDLSAELSRAAADGEARYAVALSGGGTRAALYSYAVLRGLHQRDALDRVLLVSSVSGGSAAAAYLGAHHSTLLAAPGGDGGPWLDFREAMAAPFIHDVLAGVGEWRFLDGTRLGQLLTESFDRALRRTGEGCRTLGCVSGADAPLGLAFNAGVAGAWRSDTLYGGACIEGGGTPRGCARVDRSGSRLAITNIDELNEAAARSAVPGWPLDLDYATVHSADASLAAAASIAANFPPVFANAGVEVKGDVDAYYWVTDGGAVDNRGVISLLLALRAALDQLEDESVAADRRLPPFKLVVAEASSVGAGYREDRGVGALVYASIRVTNKLIAELAADIERRWRSLGSAPFEIVYLPMPQPLRIHFKTHWQMPSSIELSDPARWYDEDADSIVLDEEAVKTVIDRLFGPTPLDPPLERWLKGGPEGDPGDILDRVVSADGL